MVILTVKHSIANSEHEYTSSCDETEFVHGAQSNDIACPTGNPNDRKSGRFIIVISIWRGRIGERLHDCGVGIDRLRQKDVHLR